ncbi:MAG: AglZ/HisF2 family acetamidino modification protein [Coxiellaceae bacterium]|nr:AglZ/HisF2 family acetamidino modification protein [Coxiellaceae bacterium]
MLKPRIIPCLLIKNGGLVKTVNFKNEKYVGDPLNAVKIFNEKQVDELIVLDIDASRYGREPNYKLISHLSAECRMPLCYGGGIRGVEQANKILSLGVEKVAMSSAVIKSPDLVSEMSKEIGSQSVVVVLDIKQRRFSGYDVYYHNATQKSDIKLFDFIRCVQNLGAGELVLNSIDQDGVMKGYDLSLIEKTMQLARVPVTALGGAGSIEHIQSLVENHKIIGAGAGSMFVFKGVYRAVLINYLTEVQKDYINSISLEPELQG